MGVEDLLKREGDAIGPVIRAVTDRIVARSTVTRQRYLDRIDGTARRRPARMDLGCANLTHGFAAAEPTAKLKSAPRT